MNKTLIPNHASLVATDYISTRMKQLMNDKNITGIDLSRRTRISVKSIYDYIHGCRYPKIDVLAQIFSVLGETEMIIPLSGWGDKNEIN